MPRDGNMQVNIQDIDAQITRNILTVGEDMTQPIASGSFTPNGSNNTVTVPFRNVGLIRGFILKVTATFGNSGSGQATLTDWGAANLVSNVTLTDLDNYQRINTTGWHLYSIAADKEGFPFGAAVLNASMNSPVNYGNNFSVISASATIAASTGTGSVQMYYWIPCSYGKHDLRGAIWAGVVNSNAFVSFTINPIPNIPTGDTVNAIYKGANTVVTYTNVTWTLYQNYVDQLPRYTSGPNAGAPVLPPLSIRTQYRLVNTVLTGVVANQDFNIPFTNFQSFLSTTVILDQNGTLNSGSDVNQWKFTAANTLQFFYLDPITQALKSRVRMKADMPPGSYMFTFREQPVNTNQAGNMQLTLNASSASGSTSLLVGWEAFANVNTVLGAQSLASS